MKKGNVEAIKAKAIEDGYLVVEEVEGVKKYRNRSLKDLLEWKLSAKKMTKKDILEHLQRVAKGASGARERNRADSLIPYFKNLVVKDVQSAGG
jgi:ectoine hydroxylase-related dioxygenase (phytanoyl-CoA dioxygenase family)